MSKSLKVRIVDFKAIFFHLTMKFFKWMSSLWNHSPRLATDDSHRRIQWNGKGTNLDYHTCPICMVLNHSMNCRLFIALLFDNIWCIASTRFHYVTLTPITYHPAGISQNRTLLFPSVLIRFKRVTFRSARQLAKRVYLCDSDWSTSWSNLIGWNEMDWIIRETTKRCSDFWH